MFREDKTLGFIPKSTKCDCCYKFGAKYFDGKRFFCEDCWQNGKQTMNKKQENEKMKWNQTLKINEQEMIAIWEENGNICFTAKNLLSKVITRVIIPKAKNFVCAIKEKPMETNESSANLMMPYESIITDK